VEAGERLDEVLGELRRGDEGALPLDPGNEPLPVEVGERLADDRATDVEALAKCGLGRQLPADRERARRHRALQQLPQLVVVGHR
jgi:hypothetical protein